MAIDWHEYQQALIDGDIDKFTISDEEQRMLNTIRTAYDSIQERVTIVEARLKKEVKEQQEFIDELLTRMEQFSQVFVDHKRYKIVVMKYMPAIKEVHGFDAKTISAINENFKEILATLGEFVIYTDSVDMKKEVLPESGVIIDPEPIDV